jgi:hypothetical protein
MVPFVTELLHLDRKTVQVITLDAISVNATFNLKRWSIHGTTFLLLRDVELLAAGDAYGLWFIAEDLAPEQFAIALIINRSHDGNIRDHACRFAVSNLLSIGVTGVRHNLKTIYI